MDKDLATNVKSLAMGIAHYQSSPSQSNLSHVLRHIEVLLGGLNLSETLRLFSSRCALGSQCITEMIKLLTEKETNSHLFSKTIDLLDTIAKVHEVCDHLQNSFSLSAILFDHVAQFGTQEQYSHIIPQILVLLEKLTYKRPISSGTARLHQLLEFLLQQLENEESDTFTSALSLMNNLVSYNLSIQVQMKSMLSVQRTKNLVQLLKQISNQCGILALSVLSAIFWKDDIGKKLYQGQNWFKAMKIIFHTLFDDTNIVAQKTAADLCIELLHHEEVAQQIAMYEEQHGCINKLFELLEADSPAASKILEVLLEFCNLSLVRTSICQRIFGNGEKCWEVLLRVAASSVNDLRLPVEKSPSLLALALTKEICEETVESTTTPLQDWTKDLMQMINLHLSQPFHDSAPHLNFHLLKILKTIQILLCMCSEDDNFHALVTQSLSHDNLETVLEYQLTHNLTGIVSAQPEWSNVGIEVVLCILELMLEMKHHVPGIEKRFFAALQDVRIVPFLVSALSSTKSSKVQCALRLYQEASSLPDFPFILFGEKIAELNSKKENGNLCLGSTSRGAESVDFCVTEIKTPRSQIDRPDSIWHDIHKSNALDGVSVATVSSSSSTEDKENLDALASKLHNRMNSDRKIFGKTAEILEVYEQKISSLKTKESHLQDLLDAKSLALVQADRVIARHRCQQTQLEEESRKLAHMFQESETKCEHLIQDIQNTDANRQEVEKELQVTVEENRGLQKIAEQYDSLQIAFNDKIHRIEVQERNLATQKQEYDTLKEMHDMFQKHNEKLKIQVNEGVQRLEQLEDEKMKLLKESGDKQVKIHELESLVMEGEKLARQLLDEKSEQEAINKHLHSDKENLQEEVKNQKMKLMSLERAGKQLEHQLKEKGTEIKKLHQCNSNLVEKVSTILSEKQGLSDDIAGHQQTIKRLERKLEEQKRTFSKITELSAALHSSQT